MAPPPCEQTAYAIGGPVDAPVVALVHGLGLNRQMWGDIETTLLERYRVLNYDLFGHGQSAPPTATPSLAVFSEQLRCLLDGLGIERATIVGFSLGGMINRRFALDYPERTRALAIFNSPHERDAEAQKAVEARALRVAEGGSAATIEAALERWFTPEFRASRPDYIARVREWRMAADPVSYPQSCQVLATGVIELIRPSPPIRVPTLVMTAEHDSGSTPAMAHAIAAEIAAAQTIIVPGLRHMGLAEAPTLFSEPLMRFLDTQASE